MPLITAGFVQRTEGKPPPERGSKKEESKEGRKASRLHVNEEEMLPPGNPGGTFYERQEENRQVSEAESKTERG